MAPRRAALPLAAAAWAAAGAAPELRLRLFEEAFAKERGAQCLDHSPAGYYIREQDPSRWVVFLEGGGLCVETVDCAIRAAGTPAGSSSSWKADATPENNHMLTALSPLNPFANWSHVYVPYCSGDTWLGNSKEGHVALLGLQMSGHLILEAVMQHLHNHSSIANATNVVLGGTSAGGIGAFHHADWFEERLRGMAAGAGAKPPDFAVIPVEGVFFPAKFPVLFPEFILGIHKAADAIVSKYLANLFGPVWMHEGCVAARGEDASLCWDVSALVGYVKARLFVVTNLFDQLMIHDIGTCLPCSNETSARSLPGRYVRFFGGLMRETLQQFRKAHRSLGVFASSEYHHDENWVDIFTTREKKIHGESLSSAISRWYFKREQVVLVQDRCGADAAGPCGPGVDSARRRGLRRPGGDLGLLG